MELLQAALLIALTLFVSLLCWLLFMLIGAIRRRRRPPAGRRGETLMQRRLQRVRELPQERPASASLDADPLAYPLSAPRRPPRPLLDEPPASLPVPASRRPAEPAMWALDPIFEREPEDRGLAVPLERLLVLMLEGRRLERRPYTYGLDEWLLLPLRPDLDGAMMVRVADAERAARHPSVTDASASFGQPTGTSYLHRDTVPFLLIWARLRADADEEHRRRELEGDW